MAELTDEGISPARIRNVVSVFAQVLDLARDARATDELIEQYVAEAEEGYDLDELHVRRGRPLLGRAPATTFAVRLDPDLRAALDERAEQDGVSSAEVVRQALRHNLGA